MLSRMRLLLLYVAGLNFVLLYYILRPLAQSLRISALKLLAGLPQAVRYDILHPQKALVVRELGMALDDSKRAVRKEAIVARLANRFFLGQLTELDFYCRAAWFSYKG